MSNTESLKLIDGIFTSEDAKDILCHLIDKKINFHSTRIFGMDERFGKEDTYSKQRIVELKATRAALLQIIEQAASTGKNLKLNADIQIDFTNSAATAQSKELVEMPA